MSNTKKQEFIIEIKRIQNIIFKAQEAYWVSWHSQPNTEDYDKDVSNQKKVNVFFQYIADVCWQITVIELVKLYVDSDNQQFNLKKFISKLKPNGYFGSISISETKILEWDTKISEVQNLIDNLRLQRDKVYAHDDRDNSNVINTVSYKNARKMISIAIEIVSDIYTIIDPETSHSFYLLNSANENLERIIKRLANEQKLQM